MFILGSVKFRQVVQKCEMEEHRHNHNRYDPKNIALSFLGPK